MTFSIVGRCARTGRLGVVVTSSSPAVAARCAWVRAAAGAVSTQNVTDPSLGPRVLDLLEAGRTAADALDEALAATAYPDYRQAVVVDARGGVASYHGARTLGRHGEAVGVDCIAAGNLLADDQVPAAMVAAFEKEPDDPVAVRLLAALRAGAETGGEEGPVHSCGLQVVDEVSWPTTDLRVDWHDDPISELERLWNLWRPQEADYVARALDPGSAPSYGVPGDD